MKDTTTNVANITIAQMRNGEPGITVGGFIYFTCCDCCLTHLLKIEVAEHAKEEFLITGWRDDFLTEGVRQKLEEDRQKEVFESVLPTAKRKTHKVSKRA